MTDTTEETPSQRQARIRREKREAKIKAGGSERLEKITRLSGRTPESMRDEYGPPPTATLPSSDQAASTARPASQPQLQPSPPAPSSDPAQQQAQEEYLRTLLRGPDPSTQSPDQQPSDDPFQKLFSSFLDTQNPTDPNAPSSLPFSSDDLTKATGLPPFVTNLIFPSPSPTQTPAQRTAAAVWRAVHALFAVCVGLYVVWMVDAHTEMFGTRPPPPATVWNPWSVFVLGEVVLRGTRMLVGAGTAEGTAQRMGMGVKEWIGVVRSVVGDALLVVFVMGIVEWWRGEAVR